MKLSFNSVYKDRPAAEKILYGLMRVRLVEDDPFTNISHRRMPDYRAHVKFVRSRPYRLWYIIRAEGLPAGSLNATKLNEIGIVLFPDYRRLGIGKWAIQQFLLRHKPLPAVPGARSGRWLANINPLNAPSIALFKGLGFELLQHTYAR